MARTGNPVGWCDATLHSPDTTSCPLACSPQVTLLTRGPLEITNVDPTKSFMPFALVELGKLGLPLPSTTEVGPKLGHSFKPPVVTEVDHSGSTFYETFGDV